MKELAKNAASIFLAAAAITLLAFALVKGMDKQAEADCVKLQEQSVEYAHAGFYITEYQDAKCRHHGIIVDAPILTTNNYE